MIVVLLRFCLLIVMASSFIALMGCEEDNGTSGNGPTVTSITPALVYPGETNVRGTITGTGFVGIGAVDLGPDIQILKTNLISNTEIAIRFTVGPMPHPDQGRSQLQLLRDKDNSMESLVSQKTVRLKRAFQLILHRAAEVLKLRLMLPLHKMPMVRFNSMSGILGMAEKVRAKL